MAEKYKFGFFEKREIACNTNYKFIAAISYNILLYVTGFIVSYFFYKLFVTINVVIILVNILQFVTIVVYVRYSSLRSRLIFFFFTFAFVHSFSFFGINPFESHSLRVPSSSICVHWCSRVFYLRLRLCSSCAHVRSNCFHWCSLVFTRAHWCSDTCVTLG